MTVTINGTTGIAGTNGSAGTPAVQGEDTNTGIFFPAADTVAVATAGTERVRVDSSGNLGLGTSDPATLGGGSKLTVNQGADGNIVFARGGSVRQVQLGTSSTMGYINADNTSGGLGFNVNGSEAARLDSSGNLGLGVTPSAWGGVFKAFDVNSGGSYSGTSSTARMFGNSYYNGSSYIYKSSGYANYYYCGDGQHAWFNAPSGTAGNAITFTQAMTLDASGNLLVGTTTTGLSNQTGMVVNNAAGATYISVGHPNGTGSGAAYMGFPYNGGTIGSITQNGTTGVSYNTSSDYRLKENVAPMQNALDTVAQLNPVTYTWKADGSAGQGFIAHELQAVVPDCVTGEKDAVDADGNPQYQGVDTSFLVATLVKALQEAHGLIAALEQRVAVLETA